MLSLVTLIAVFSIACKKDKLGDDAEREHDHESVHTVELHLTREGTTTAIISKWVDEDGDGGKDPVVDEMELEADAVYNFFIVLKDAHGHLLTEEIVQQEAHAHRFYYLPSKPALLAVSDLDQDTNKITLGSKGVIKTFSHAHGNLRIILRHYGTAKKSESDLADHAAASTDMDIQFKVGVH